MSRNIGKNINKTLIGKYSQELIDPAKQSATDAFKTPSKIKIPKKLEATGDLIGNKIAVAKSYDGKITKVSKTSPQINSETVANEEENIGLDREIPRERYISPEKKTENY